MYPFVVVFDQNLPIAPVPSQAAKHGLELEREAKANAPSAGNRCRSCPRHPM